MGFDFKTYWILELCFLFHSMIDTIYLFISLSNHKSKTDRIQLKMKAILPYGAFLFQLRLSNLEHDPNLGPLT